MSLDVENLKFTIFGSGFNDTRADSGDGSITYEKSLNFNTHNACIDDTSTYVWLADNSRLAKVRISDLEFVGVSTIPMNKYTYIFHPSNVENNLGIAFQKNGNNTDVFVFDLTTDEVFYQFTTSTGWYSTNCDCIMSGNNVYFVSRAGGVAIWQLNLDNETLVQTAGVTLANNGLTYGFVDTDTVYACVNSVWFSDVSIRYGYGLTGNEQWKITSVGTGSGSFPRCEETGLCGNGFVWLPVNIGGVWKWGRFDGNHGGDFETPTPSKIIGNFESSPRTFNSQIQYTDERTRASYYNSTFGLMVVNFDDSEVYVVTEEERTPVAMDKKFVITTHGQNTYIIRYR